MLGFSLVSLERQEFLRVFTQKNTLQQKVHRQGTTLKWKGIKENNIYDQSSYKNTVTVLTQYGDL